jgi:hypothetical protein
LVYGIRVGGHFGEYFDVTYIEESRRMYNYCENRYGFKGVWWEKIKDDNNLELLEGIFKVLDVSFEEYDDE